MNPNVVWGLLLAFGALYEAWGLLNKAPGDTLSERTRAWFRVREKPGRAVFLVGWSGFAVWFAVHIVTGWV